MAREVVYRGRKIQVAVDTMPLPNGDVLRRDVIYHPGAVVILPMVDDDHVCLIRNHRFVIGETLLELPAGTLEPPEPPDVAAVRELAEETGYQARRWRKLIEFYASPGVLDERMHLYVAQDLTPGSQELKHDEQIELEVLSWSEAMKAACNGAIRDAKTLVGLFLWNELRSCSPTA